MWQNKSQDELSESLLNSLNQNFRIESLDEKQVFDAPPGALLVGSKLSFSRLGPQLESAAQIGCRSSQRRAPSNYRHSSITATGDSLEARWTPNSAQGAGSKMIDEPADLAGNERGERQEQLSQWLPLNLLGESAYSLWSPTEMLICPQRCLPSSPITWKPQINLSRMFRVNRKSETQTYRNHFGLCKADRRAFISVVGFVAGESVGEVCVSGGQLKAGRNSQLALEAKADRLAGGFHNDEHHSKLGG